MPSKLRPQLSTMTNHNSRPPYRAALAVAAIVLAGYIWTLAPTVTFWDAGEFIAAAKILGIPHPPGTPLFVMMAHVWANLLPFGEFAWRTNLLSAVLSAAGAGFWFLVAHEVISRAARDLDTKLAVILSYGGAAAGSFAAAFAFTTWQNSNETEVYMVATLTIAMVSWLALRWRQARGAPRAPQLLLLIIYLGGLSIGNHLLALLAGPGLLAFMVSELKANPANNPALRRSELAQVAVFMGVWALLIGLGLGNTALVLVGGLLFLIAAALAWRWGQVQFAGMALALALIGVTPYLYLYFRAAQGPMVNEADPSTWQALLDVIRRAQYPIRTPLDNPMEMHGPENSGRSLSILWLQVVNYWQYFDWQWARGIAAQVAGVPLRLLVTLGAIFMGISGAIGHWRSDRRSWWLLAIIWLATGPGLVAYMNFKPGFSIGYDLYPSPDLHEVRERDYFFVASFVVWGIWIGMGLAKWAATLMSRVSSGRRPWAAAVLLLGLVPAVSNFEPASRRHGADARLAADFAYNLLNSVPPYGVLFTFGDNDTFPLWWAQEVEGIRQDVTVVCLALAETDWFMRQLRDNPLRDFDEASAPAIWRGLNPVKPDWPLHDMTDAEIAAAVPQLIPRDSEIAFGGFRVQVRAGTPFYGQDFLAVRVLQRNFGRRPIVWSITAGSDYQGLDPLIVQRGASFWLETSLPDSSNSQLGVLSSGAPPLDLPMTDRLLTETYRYSDLLRRGPGGLDATSRTIAATLAVPFSQMASIAEQRQDWSNMIRWLEPAAQLSENPILTRALEIARSRLTSSQP